jgi:hypothetical protein
MAAQMSHAVWMQTIGTTPISVKRCSLVCLWLPAQLGGSRSAHELLYSLLYGTTGASIKIIDIGSPNTLSTSARLGPA